MGMFDQNGGRLPAAGQSMGTANAMAGPQAMPAQAMAGPQMAPQMGAASQITPPQRLDGAGLMPPQGQQVIGMAGNNPIYGQPPQQSPADQAASAAKFSGVSGYAPLNFNAPRQDAMQRPPTLDQGPGAYPQGPMTQGISQRPMPPQAMGGGNFDHRQIPEGGIMNHPAMNFMPPEGRQQIQQAMPQVQQYLAANGRLPPIAPGVDRAAAEAGFKAMGFDPAKYGGLQQQGNGNPQMLAQALMNRR